MPLRATSQVQSLGPRYDCLSLQPRPAPKPYAAHHHCLRTLARMAIEDLSRPRMVALAATPVTNGQHSVHSPSASMSSRGASGTVARNAIRTIHKNTNYWRIVAPTTCTSAPRRNYSSCGKKGATSSPYGNANGCKLNNERGCGQLGIVQPLEPWDAFCGGQTDAVKLYYSADESQDELMKYYDFMFLKPFVSKKTRNPACHPEIISQSGHTDISCYLGFAKCMLPPECFTQIFLSDKTVTFPLCVTCVEEEMEKPMLEWSHYCAHTDQQRQIISTWCKPEMQKVVEKGYEIRCIHELWHFETSKERVFKNYVDTRSRRKEEASG